MRVVLIAGEASGDKLGAGLIQSLQTFSPSLHCEGITGPEMVKAGCQSLGSIEDLSVMGVVDVLKNLVRLLSFRKRILHYLLKNPPDIFIGIDAPDFNLFLEKKLKKAGIPVIHYVSPTVWAWRSGRIKTLEKACDHLLSILPFEPAFYKKYSPLPVTFVGHPLADELPLEVDVSSARQALGFSPDDSVIALLPGSRANEIKYLAEPFLRAAQKILIAMPKMKFIVPMVNAARRQQFEKIWKQCAPELALKIVEGQSREAMAASDVVLLASGTASLEAMLLKKPMVVGYKMSALNIWLAKHLIKTDYISFPNLLAGEPLVPELIQNALTPDRLCQEILNYFSAPEKREALKKRFLILHQLMKKNANQQAAEIIMNTALIT